MLSASKLKPLPKLHKVWHNFNDQDLELCVAPTELGYPCRLPAFYDDDPLKVDMQFWEAHKFNEEGFLPTYILKYIEEKDNLDD